jgi:hypothetical protein
MRKEPELVSVYISQGPLLAEMAKSKLESQGVPVLLRYQAIGRVLGLTVDGLGRVEVLVPVEFEATARDILEELPQASEPPEPSETE